MPRCFRCCVDFRTRQQFVEHLTLHHPSGTPGAKEVPSVYELEVIVGRPRQNLFCPHPYCLYLVKNVASTRSLARHFQKNHPDHDIIFKFKCDQCGVSVDATDRSNHVCGHVNSVNCANDSISYDVNVSLIAGDDFDSPPASVGLRLAPNPRYCFPSSALGSPSPSTIPSSPLSQLPPTQSSGIPIDTGRSSPSNSARSYDIPPSSSAQLISPTSSFNSSVEIPSDVRDDPTAPYPSAPSSPAPGLPILQLASNDANFPQRSPSLEVKAVSPPGPLHLSDSPEEFTPASNYSDPYPSACQTEKTDVVKPKVKACDPFFPSFAEPSIASHHIPESPDVHPSSPTSRLSVSPGDSPSQRRLLVGSSPPPAVVAPKMRPSPQSTSNPRRVLKKPSPPSTKCLPKNDLRHRLIAGAVPSNVTDDDVEVESRSCYLKGQHDLLVKLKRVCQDSEETSQPSSSPPPQVADVRHVIIQDSPQSPSFVEVPSSSPSSQCIVDSLAAAENTRFALKVLRETFHRQPPASPPPRVPSTAGLVHSGASCEKAIESPLLFDDPPTSSTRASSPVAPPLPISKQLHPARSLYNPISHRRVSAANVVPRPSVSGMVAGLINEIRKESPPAFPTSGETENVVNVVPHDRDDNDNDNIPSAQPRRPRSPDIAADPPAQPDSPPANDPDVNEDLDASQDLLIEPVELDKLNEFRALWIERFNGDHSWQEFSVLCERFAVETKEMAQSLSKPMAPKPAGDQQNPPPPPPPPPPRRRPPHDRGFRPFNPVEARRIQGLYRHSKKRAARKLLCDTAVQYSGSDADVETYFEGVLSEKTCNSNLLNEALRADVPTAEDDESTRDLKNEVSESEVAAKLRSAANTAPGYDKVEYAHLKRIDPSVKILTPMFNRCIQAKDVPAIWKQAVTVLIYKKGDPTDVSNFRPIALMSCIYKLLMGIMARRLTRWSIETGILSAEQKSARPTEGCYEHTYVMKSLVGQARRNKKKLSLAWLDIRNAFGSVPHHAITTTLRYLGVPQELITLILNAYTGASSTFKTPDGLTRSIPVRAGVKQGCPLSPILFNLCIKLILRRVKNAASKLKSGQCIHYGTVISCLAYADDLVLIARSKQALQNLLDAAADAANIVGFSFRPDKCASLSLTSTRQRATFVEPVDFTIQGNHIPALTNEQSNRYLGVPIGLIHNIDDIPNIIPQLIKHIELIGSSLLAPWQKLDALRTFIQPCLRYALRAGNPVMQSLDLYRSTLVRTLRDICSLPNRATAAYFFASKRTGGLAFQDPRTECDVQAIVQAVRILASDDPAVAAMARQELKYIVRRSTQLNPTSELLSTYLSSTPDPRTEKLYYTYSSLWSRVRQACRRLKISFHYSENNEITIATEESERIKSKQVTTFLHRVVQSRFGSELMSLKDQGKVARCLSEDQYANGSTWHCSGLNLRFKDWRFIHRARLNVLPLNANKSRYSNTDATCRHCASDPETLPHVVCHCPPHMVQIRGRHNSIVDRLTNAIRLW